MGRVRWRWNIHQIIQCHHNAGFRFTALFQLYSVLNKTPQFFTVFSEIFQYQLHFDGNRNIALHYYHNPEIELITPTSGINNYT